MGMGVVFLIVITAAAALFCFIITVGMLVIHPWLLLVVLAVALLCYWRHRVNERPRRVARHEDHQIKLAILADAEEHRAEADAAVQYAKDHPTARRTPRVIQGHDLKTGHEPTFRPWAGW